MLCLVGGRTQTLQPRGDPGTLGSDWLGERSWGLIGRRERDSESIADTGRHMKIC